MPLLYALKTFHATKEKTKQNSSLQQMLFAETAATTIAFNHHLILTFPLYLHLHSLHCSLSQLLCHMIAMIK